MSPQALGPTQPPISKVKVPCPGEEEAGRDTDYSPASSAEVNR